MQFIDLHKQFARIENEIRAGMDRVYQHKQFIMGPEVRELEKQLAEYAGVKHAITCASGTDALVIPLMAKELTAKDAIFVPSFSFFASAESVSLAGGTPVFVDSDAKTFNMSVTSLEEQIQRVLQEGKLTPRGIIPVDLFGQPANYTEIQNIADQYGLFILVDAAQGFGAELSGKRAGSFGNVTATSFFPSKPLACYGDGGAIFTNDDDLLDTMLSIRVHGQGKDKYENVRIGMNGRLDSMQAVVLLAKLGIFSEEVTLRNQAAAFYTECLKDVIETPYVPEGYVSAWAQYTLKARNAQEREHIIASLKAQEIPTMIYYPIPIHLQKAYAHLGGKIGDLPVCETLSQTVFSIPMHPYLEEKEMLKICDVIKGALV